MIVGVSIGLLAGRYRDTWIDVSGRMFGIVIYAFPVFFLGFLLQLLFGSVLGWLPTTGRASPVVEFELDKISHFYLLDAVLTWNWSAFWDAPAPDPARGDARPGDQRRAHPARARSTCCRR